MYIAFNYKNVSTLALNSLCLLFPSFNDVMRLV